MNHRDLLEWFRRSHGRCSVKKGVLKNITNFTGQKQSQEVFHKEAVLKNFSIFTGKHLCWSLFLLKLQAWRLATLLKRHSKVFFCEYCKVFKRSYFEEYQWATASNRKTSALESFLIILLLYRPVTLLKRYSNTEAFKICKNTYLKNICERLLLFVSHQNTIANSGGEFGLDEASTESKVSIFWKVTILFNQMQP